jgi:hypothetical protein
MSPRAAARLAWGIWGLGLACLAITLALVPQVSQEPAVVVFAYITIILTCGLVGAIVVSRQPANPIGWILCLVGFIFALSAVVSEYGEYAVSVKGGSLPAGRAAVWFGSWLWLPGVLLPSTLLLLLFPDGRPLSRRWRVFSWLAIIGLIGMVAGTALEPGPLGDSSPIIENPFGLLGVPGKVVGFLAPFGFFLTVPSIAAGPISLILRFRRARGDQRQQIKWLAFAGSFTAAALLTGFIIGSTSVSARAEEILNAVILLSIAVIPLGAGVAILKYRLYDIDLVINRTLVYGALTLMLGGVYVAGVVGLGSLVRSLTGQENNSLVIAASTLGVAALFRPARRGIQAFIDRRFYRQKYDAARTLETFSARLRDEVDLDSLTGELVGVVRDTMQPSHVSVWLRSLEEAP